MKLYLILAVVLGLAASHYWMYHRGVEACRSDITAATLEAKKEEDKAIIDAQKEEKQIQIVYRDRIKIVKESRDACMDTALPAAVLDSLRADLPPE
jgi:hypothetical protein